jgi:hypothetical protein
MSFREAAILPIAYLTAYILLFEMGNIKPNQTLLFHSAGGGVGGKRKHSFAFFLLQILPSLSPSRTNSTF